MSRSLRALSAAMTASLIGSNSIVAQQTSSDQRPMSVQIIVGPAVESATEKSAIIRWMSTTPAGAAEHFGVVHYGADPKDFSQMAKSPIRLNMAHPNTIFRVRVDGLMPGTTYYYTVDSTGPDGTSDGVKVTVNRFRTRHVEQPK
jgi:phosphodiesterase/alkaline phosphatase D-like protein